MLKVEQRANEVVKGADIEDAEEAVGGARRRCGIMGIVVLSIRRETRSPFGMPKGKERRVNGVVG